MIYDYKLRKPNQAEREQLIQFLVEYYKMEPEISCDLVNETCIAVIDGYITESPGYAGSVMIVVWPAGPQAVDSFTWSTDTGKLEREEIEL